MNKNVALLDLGERFAGEMREIALPAIVNDILLFMSQVQL